MGGAGGQGGQAAAVQLAAAQQLMEGSACVFPALLPHSAFPSPTTCQMGLDLVEGRVRDNIAAGVVEPALSKTKIIQFATEAAITILRIDDLIRLEPEPQEGEEH